MGVYVLRLNRCVDLSRWALFIIVAHGAFKIW